jgi:hypothetical protein
MQPTNGVFRVILDAAVQQTGEREWSGISREPVEAGETLTLDVELFVTSEGPARQRFPVYVIDSYPMTVDGVSMYRIRVLRAVPPPVLFEQQVRRN